MNIFYSITFMRNHCKLSRKYFDQGFDIQDVSRERTMIFKIIYIFFHHNLHSRPSRRITCEISLYSTRININTLMICLVSILRDFLALFVTPNETPRALVQTPPWAQGTTALPGYRFAHCSMQLNDKHISREGILQFPHQSTLMSRNCNAKNTTMTAIAVPHVNALEVRY